MLLTVAVTDARIEPMRVNLSEMRLASSISRRSFGVTAGALVSDRLRRGIPDSPAHAT